MNNSNKKGRLVKLMSGRGFYIALAVCLIGAGTAAWAIVDRTLDIISQDNSVPMEISSQEEKQWTFPEVEAEKKASDIEVPSQPSSSPSTPPSSSQPSEEPAGQSVQPTLSPRESTSSYVLPVDSNEIINPYSNGELVKNVTLNKWNTHDGVDYQAPEGTEVKAVSAGVVKSVADDQLWGITVVIDHKNGYESVYCGLQDEVFVNEGDEVTVSQVIGKLGRTNIAESKLDSHLHFAMRYNGEYADPVASLASLTID